MARALWRRSRRAEGVRLRQAAAPAIRLAAASARGGATRSAESVRESHQPKETNVAHLERRCSVADPERRPGGGAGLSEQTSDTGRAVRAQRQLGSAGAAHRAEAH